MRYTPLENTKDRLKRRKKSVLSSCIWSKPCWRSWNFMVFPKINYLTVAVLTVYVYKQTVSLCIRIISELMPKLYILYPFVCMTGTSEWERFLLSGSIEILWNFKTRKHFNMNVKFSSHANQKKRMFL